MLDHIPEELELSALLGAPLFTVWQALRCAIEGAYDMDTLWDSGGKKWTWELKYRRGGKTLCSLLLREDTLGLLIIFGQGERERFEALRGDLPGEVLRAYDEATTYHDGKWVLFLPKDTACFGAYLRLLALKRRPNRHV